MELRGAEGKAQVDSIQAGLKALREEVFTGLDECYVASAVEVVIWHLSEAILNEATARRHSGMIEIQDFPCLPTVRSTSPSGSR